MTLNGRYALCCRKDASFGAYHKNLNEDRPILSAAKRYNNESSFWRFKTCANIRGVSPGRGRQTTVGLSTTAIVSVFAGYFSDPLKMRPCDMAIYSPSSAFQWSQNAWPWMPLTGYFALNSVFAPAWLAETVRLRKIIAWKLIKIDTYCQRCKSSAGTLVSGNICLCGYRIRSGSLEKRR